MNKLYKLVILLVMVGTASAAVYHVTTNPEMRLYFGLDHKDVNPMQNTIDGGGFWTNSLGLGNIQSNTSLIKDIQHKNTDEDVYSARIFITIECDEGIDIESHTHMGEIIYDGIEDFTHITYKYPDNTIIECNNMTFIEVLSGTKVKISPRQEETEFPPQSSRYSILSMGFNDMSYGNYLVIVDTEEVE